MNLILQNHYCNENIKILFEETITYRFRRILQRVLILLKPALMQVFILLF